MLDISPLLHSIFYKAVYSHVRKISILVLLPLAMHTYYLIKKQQMGLEMGVFVG